VGKKKRSRRAERQTTPPRAGQQDVERMIVIATTCSTRPSVSSSTVPRNPVLVVRDSSMT